MKSTFISEKFKENFEKMKKIVSYKSQYC